MRCFLKAMRLLTLPFPLGMGSVNPFAGIGSEGWAALKMNRRFIGIELKESYVRAAVKYLASAEQSRAQMGLFDGLEEEVG